MCNTKLCNNDYRADDENNNNNNNNNNKNMNKNNNKINGYKVDGDDDSGDKNGTRSKLNGFHFSSAVTLASPSGLSSYCLVSNHLMMMEMVKMRMMKKMMTIVKTGVKLRKVMIIVMVVRMMMRRLGVTEGLNSFLSHEKYL